MMKRDDPECITQTSWSWIVQKFFMLPIFLGANIQISLGSFEDWSKPIQVFSFYSQIRELGHGLPKIEGNINLSIDFYKRSFSRISNPNWNLLFPSWNKSKRWQTKQNEFVKKLSRFISSKSAYWNNLYQRRMVIYSREVSKWSLEIEH